MRFHGLRSRGLHAQIEQFFLQLKQLLLQFGHRLGSQFTCLHDHSTVLVTNAVLTDNLAAARRNASRAISSVTPSISYNTVPGLIRATQNSTLPLPLPIRTSTGFLVTGTSVNTRIQTLPPRLICRVMARRADSSSRALTRPRPMAFNPYSPKLTLLPDWARPRLRPFICLRNLVRFGCIITVLLYSMAYAVAVSLPAAALA